MEHVLPARFHFMPQIWLLYLHRWIPAITDDFGNLVPINASSTIISLSLRD